MRISLWRHLIVSLIYFSCLPGVLHSEVPEPPEGLGDGSGYDVSPGIVRASMRYLNALLAAEGPNVVLVFPGRSMTVMSILAEQKGLSVVNVPGSGLTESLAPAKWQDPQTRNKLELYQWLVGERVSEAVQAHPKKKLVVVDMADTGDSVVYFEKMLSDILIQMGAKPKIESYYVRDFGMRSGVSQRLTEAGIKELTIDVPYDTSGKKMTEAESQAWMDRFYRHQPEAIAFAGTAGNVPKFDILDVSPESVESVKVYRQKFAQPGNSQNQLLRKYISDLSDRIVKEGSPLLQCSHLFSKIK